MWHQTSQQCSPETCDVCIQEQRSGAATEGATGGAGALHHVTRNHTRKITHTHTHQKTHGRTQNTRRASSFMALESPFLYSQCLRHLYSQGWCVSVAGVDVNVNDDVDVDGRSTGGDLHKSTQTAKQDTAGIGGKYTPLARRVVAQILQFLSLRHMAPP